MAQDLENGVSKVFQIILAAAFGAWAWVVKKAADRHIEAVIKLEDEMAQLLLRVNTLETKIMFLLRDNNVYKDFYPENDR